MTSSRLYKLTVKLTFKIPAGVLPSQANQIQIIANSIPEDLIGIDISRYVQLQILKTPSEIEGITDAKNQDTLRELYCNIFNQNFFNEIQPPNSESLESEVSIIVEKESVSEKVISEIEKSPIGLSKYFKY